jgi:hypothetical protein
MSEHTDSTSDRETGSSDDPLESAAHEHDEDEGRPDSREDEDEPPVAP